MITKITESQETVVKSVKCISGKFHELDEALDLGDESKWQRLEKQNILHVTMPNKRRLTLHFLDDQLSHLKKMVIHQFHDKQFIPFIELVIKKPKEEITEVVVSKYNIYGDLSDNPISYDVINKHQKVKKTAIYINRTIPEYGELRFDVRAWGITKIYYSLKDDKAATIRLFKDRSAEWRLGHSNFLKYTLITAGVIALAATAYFFI